MLKLTEENYYSQEANQQYMSVSQFKQFNGTYGRLACEYEAMEELAGRWENKTSSAMLQGSYVDSYFEGTLDKFKLENPQMFKRDGELKAEFLKCEQIIERAERDEYFMKYMSGQKQVIMTAELFGVPWKIKMDSYIPNVAIVDLKVMQSLTKLHWVPDIGYLDWVRYWGYDFQGAVYQKVVEINTGNKLPFYLAALSKEEEPDIRIIQITQNYLDEALNAIEATLPRIMQVKNGEIEAVRCDVCDCCKHNRILKSPISIADLTACI